MNREKEIYRVTLTGSIGNVLLVVFKFVAGLLGHSSAMIADAVHSLSDFITDIVVLVFVRISARPQDESHDYGHGKFETIASFLIGLALMAAAAGIIASGSWKLLLWWNGVELAAPGWIALWAALLSIAVKELLYQYTARKGRALRSQVMVANAWHHRSDAISSVGAAIGIGGALWLGSRWTVLDPLASVVVGLMLIKVACHLLRASMGELTECSLPEETEQAIIDIICSFPDVQQPHNLRTRRIGDHIAIEAHVRMDGKLPLSVVHERATAIEHQLKDRFGQATHVTIHMEPLHDSHLGSATHRYHIILLGVLMAVCACTQKKQEPVVTPWGEVQYSIPADSSFDLDEIQQNGELIALTLTGPETYYDYHGKHLGAQYLLAQRFADKLGVMLRMEVCRDTAEMLQRLADGEADLICYPMTKKGSGWTVGSDKDDLVRELEAWWKPSLLAEVKKEEDFLLSSRSVTRRVFSPMLNRAGGVISHYDGFFQRYASTIRWDWRLLAAQCYQESTFDPQAHSWAGACGLMQIMPGTADHLGLARSDMYDPEKNIEAAVRYIGELDRTFSDIGDRNERIKFVLAAYNGGHFHIRDAMALAQKNGRNPRRWGDVEPYVLGLSRPEYYNDPVVRYGYMRGSETTEYVRKIHERWNGYRGVKTIRAGFSPNTVPQKAKRERKKKYQV